MGSGASATDQAKDKASQAAGQAKEQASQAAGQAAGQAKSTVRAQVDQRSTQAGERVSGFASDVRSVSDQLRQQGKDQPAKLADQAADRAERVSSYLTNSDGDKILGDLEDLGRRQPWAVIVSGLTAGLLASRFLKASSSRRYEQRSSGGNYQLPGRTASTYSDTGTYTGATRTGGTLPATPPADVTGGVGSGTAGATAPGFEGGR